MARGDMCSWGVCVACVPGGMCGRVGMWQGVCMAGGMCGRRVCMEGGMHGRGHAWQERRPLQRTVRILLKCILVFVENIALILFR